MPSIRDWIVRRIEKFLSEPIDYDRRVANDLELLKLHIRKGDVLLVDGTDGIFARNTGQATDFGAYLDIVLDMAAYSAMILGFAYANPELLDRWLVILLLYVLCITSALALGMEEAKRDLPKRDDRGLRLGAGLAESGETGIAYTLFLLLPEQLSPLTALWIAILLTTIVARTILARRRLAD